MHKIIGFNNFHQSQGLKVAYTFYLKKKNYLMPKKTKLSPFYVFLGSHVTLFKLLFTQPTPDYLPQTFQRHFSLSDFSWITNKTNKSLLLVFSIVLVISHHHRHNLCSYYHQCVLSPLWSMSVGITIMSLESSQKLWPVKHWDIDNVRS